MNGFDKPIHRKEDEPFGKIIVNPIESDKRAKDGGYKGLDNSTRFQAFATIVAFFKKMASPFSFKAKGKIYLTDQERLIDCIVRLKRALELLSNEDKSHIPEFTEQLSELWHQLVDDTALLTHSSPSLKPEALKKISFFITQVQNYPLGADHTLGFYFTSYAGKDWIPFPFMEMLQNLHEEHQKTPTHSTLANWIALLDEILAGSGVKIDL